MCRRLQGSVKYYKIFRIEISLIYVHTGIFKFEIHETLHPYVVVYLSEYPNIDYRSFLSEKFVSESFLNLGPLWVSRFLIWVIWLPFEVGNMDGSTQNLIIVDLDQFCQFLVILFENSLRKDLDALDVETLTHKRLTQKVSLRNDE